MAFVLAWMLVAGILGILKPDLSVRVHQCITAGACPPIRHGVGRAGLGCPDVRVFAVLREDESIPIGVFTRPDEVVVGVVG